MSRQHLCVAILTLAFPLLTGCTWLARYERAVATHRIPVEPPLATPATTSPAADVQTDIPPRMGFIVQAGARSPKDAMKSFTLPDGFEIQLVASEPDIQKPMQLAFDERGRLLVSTSTDYPLGAAEGRAPADRVMLLEIDGETGAATKVTPFAEGFNICSGIEALPGGRVILANAPDILLLTDTDDDGVADTREVLYTGFARDDTHEIPNSFAWGIDGWLYGLQGHVNVSNVTDRNGKTTAIHHGNVYRMRPDGSAIEVWARGMSNPWGLTFDRLQNMYGADCESRPLWQIVRGLPYQGFLQAPDPLGFAPFITEDPHGASGFAGLVSYTANAYPGDYQDCLYLGNPITGRIHRDRPVPTGTTHRVVRQPDFLVSDDPWFRPVDIELGPDGALYIADWYNSIIAHVEVPLDHPDRDKTRGRIWRVVYRGTASEDSKQQFAGPMAIDWGATPLPQLLDTLAEEHQWKRRTAAAQIRVRFATQAIAPCRRIVRGDAKSPIQRLEAAWLLHTLGALPEAHAIALLHDPDPTLRRDAVRWVAEVADADTANSLLIQCLSDVSPYVVRDAAMTLRTIPTESSLSAVLERGHTLSEDDTLLRYAVRFAARDHLKSDVVVAALKDKIDASPQAESLLELLIATPTPQAAALLADRLAQNALPAPLQRQAIDNVFANGTPELLQRVLQSLLDPSSLASGTTPHVATALYVNRDRLRKLDLDPKPYLQALTADLVDSSDRADHYVALEIAAGLRFDSALPLARNIVRDRAASWNAREWAAKLLMQHEPELGAPVLLAVVADPEEVIQVRRITARELGRHVSDKPQFDALVTALKAAPLDVYAGAIESLSTRQPAVVLLLDAVESGAISPAYINNHVTRIRIDNTHRDRSLTARYDRLVERAYNAEDEGNIVALAAHLRRRFEAESDRDLKNGRRVFEENCMKCHRIGGSGALIAPNLDGLRNRGIERVLQDIMTPSLDIDPAFRTTVLSLADGDSASGLVVRENASQLVIADTLGQERVIAKSDIEERTKLLLSPMPSGFGTSIPENDFLDLLAYLMKS